MNYLLMLLVFLVQGYALKAMDSDELFAGDLALEIPSESTFYSGFTNELAQLQSAEYPLEDPRRIDWLSEASDILYPHISPIPLSPTKRSQLEEEKLHTDARTMYHNSNQLYDSSLEFHSGPPLNHTAIQHEQMHALIAPEPLSWLEQLKKDLNQVKSDEAQEIARLAKLDDLCRIHALHIAAYRGLSRLSTVLLAKGMPLEALDSSDETPLYKAVKGNSAAVVRVLLKAGANKAFAKNNLTPYNLARLCNYEHVINAFHNHAKSQQVTFTNVSEKEIHQSCKRKRTQKAEEGTSKKQKKGTL